MDSKKWTEIEVQYGLFKWLEKRGRILILPNFTSYHWYECDLFSLTRSLYFHEIEVKVTRSDFYADFHKRDKHYCLEEQRGELPKTFYYASPRDILIPDDMPPYAGLLLVERARNKRWKTHDVEIAKKAPQLKSGKLSEKQVIKITHNIWYRYARTWKELAEKKVNG